MMVLVRPAIRPKQIFGFLAATLSLLCAGLWINSYINKNWDIKINHGMGNVFSDNGAIYWTQRSQAGINFVDAATVTNQWYVVGFGFISASVSSSASLWQLQLPFWFFTFTMACAAVVLLRRQRIPRGFEIEVEGNNEGDTL